MCTISEKIKFCTCAIGDIEKLKHYWILYRYTNENREVCIGEPLMPNYMLEMNFAENEAALVRRLNEPDAFDVAIQFEAKDQLEIVISNNFTGFFGTFTFFFIFKKNKWVAIEADTFEIMNHYDEEKAGKIKNALKRNKQNKI